MSNLGLLIYFCSVVGGLKSFFEICSASCIIFMIGLVIVTTFACMDNDETIMNFWKRNIKKFIITTITFIVVSVITPSKETMILIAASQYGQEIANNVNPNQLVDPGMKLLKAWIEKQTTELQKDKK
jgi:hypothetical protein